MKKKILLADDDKDELKLISALLRNRGYEIEVSENGEDFEKKSLDQFDVFLLDINMKGIFGTDICKRLKSHDNTKNKPVILISAALDLRTRANSCGADDYISKPFEGSELIHTIEQHL